MIPENTYLSLLTVEDIQGLEPIEDQTNLSFWGEENYRKFLLEYPEYFGAKAVVLTAAGEWEIVGFYFARSVDDNLEILKVGVSPRHQRQGIGSQLMESAYAEGIRRGCKRCFLEVRKSNEGAVQFYQRQRFRIAGSRQDYYRNPVEDAWVMERLL